MLLKLITLARNLLPARLRADVRSLMFRWLDQKWQLSSGVAIRVANYPDWILYNEIFVDRAYDAAIEMAFERPAKRICVVDLGANVGLFTLRVVDLLRRSAAASREFAVVTVEGNDRVIGELRARVAENAFFDHVKIVPGLVGERSGKAALYVPDYSHYQGSIVEGSDGSGVRMDYVDLDRLLAAEPEIHLLKCDIEGAELLFIRNYPDLLRKVRVAVFELHHAKCDTERCRRLLEESGFANEKILYRNPRASVHCFWR